MYETEVNRKTESQEQIPAEVLRLLGEVKATVLERTVLPWSEHCTECAWPSCYSTCDQYSAREDGACRRFKEGMVRVDCPDALNLYVLKITFKRWGKLWTPGNVRLRRVQEALRIEFRDHRLGTILTQLPVPAPIRGFITRKRYSAKKRLAYRTNRSSTEPTSFLIECYNPNQHSVRLSLIIRSIGKRAEIPYQKLIELLPGFHRVRVAFSEIKTVIDTDAPFHIELTPNGETKEITLFFGLMEFVRETDGSVLHQGMKMTDQAKKVKCVVWDLDNTVWSGILVEDRPEAIALKPGMRGIIEELDRRGILQSVVSKNSYDEALAMLGRFEINEFFLVPQISWLPKSHGIREIARQLNIGLDSVLFVDDSEFELSQVKKALPDVRTMGATRYMEIVDCEECKVPVSLESRERRKMYRVEKQRQDLAASFTDDYAAFLQYCDIRANIRPMMEENLERVHELTQRTNQLNFSGNRYDRNVLKEVLSTPHLETYVVEVGDRFGTYGVVGFCIVDSRVPLMTDLMFSCRIQSKHVEHALMAHLIREYTAKTGKDFQADYRKTPRNAQSGKVFADIGMRELDNKDGVSRLIFRRDQVVPEDGLVRITCTTHLLPSRS